MPGISRVLAARSMTAFTADTIFVDLCVAIVAKRYGSCGVTLEAAFNSELRVSNAVEHARSLRDRFRMQGFLSGRGAVGVGRSVPGSVMFQVPILIDSCDESAGLTARAEGPLERQIHPVRAIVNVDAESTVREENIVAILRIAGELNACGEIPVIRDSRKRSGMRAGRLRRELDGVACLARPGANVRGRGRSTRESGQGSQAIQGYRPDRHSVSPGGRSSRSAPMVEPEPFRRTLPQQTNDKLW